MIEMLVAVFIFTVSLAALMSIASRGLKASHQAQKQVIADYLALEGVEVVRNLRDSAFLSFNNTNNWQNVFNQNGCLSSVGSPCEFTLTGTSIVLQPCDSGVCTVYFDGTVYRHDESGASWDDSGYIREINLTPSANPNEINATVLVTWNNGQDSVSYSENLFLWL